MRWVWRNIAAVVIALALAGGGCRSDGALPRSAAATTSPTTRPTVPIQPFRLIRVTDDVAADPLGRPALESMSCLEIFHLSVPYGTVSGDESFWKLVDETCVDPATQQVLFGNGIRVGLARSEEWPYFGKILEKYPAVWRRSILQGREVNAIEVGLKKEVASQNLFYFAANGGLLEGRTFDYCENFMALSFQPAPRKAGTLRIAVCPVVRALRRVLQYDAGNRDQEFQYVRPERLFDLNLRADVPQESFLVIAPSVEARRPSSVGRAFLVEDGHAEQFEHVLVLVPRPRQIPQGMEGRRQR
jgi:hypothetical protein